MEILFTVLVLLLGADSFRCREAANCALIRWGDYALPALSLGEQSADEETRTRCKAIVDGWYRRNAERLAKEAEPCLGWPWVDSFPGTDGWPVDYQAVAHYRSLAEAAGFLYVPPFWPASSQATGFFVRDLIAARQPWRAAVEKLKAGQEKWIEANRK